MLYGEDRYQMSREEGEAKTTNASTALAMGVLVFHNMVFVFSMGGGCWKKMNLCSSLLFLNKMLISNTGFGNVCTVLVLSRVRTYEMRRNGP